MCDINKILTDHDLWNRSDRTDGEQILSLKDKFVLDDQTIKKLDLSYAYFDKSEIKRMIFEDVMLNGVCFRVTDFSIINFKKCSFNFADLSVTRFDECIIDESSFVNAYAANTILCLTKFYSSNIVFSNFQSSWFHTCTVYNTNIKLTNFVGAKFENTYFENCIFDNCDLSYAQFNNTIFKNITFKNAIRSKNDSSLNELEGVTVL